MTDITGEPVESGSVSPQAADELVPATDGTAADQMPEVPPPDQAAVDAAPGERALPFELEHEIGENRRKVLDHLLDSVEAGPQSVAQIHAALGNVTRGTAETAIKRNFDASLIERVAPGQYVLAKPKPPAPPKPPTPTAVEEEKWYAALEAWLVDPASWPAELGPRPDRPDRRIPLDVEERFIDRVRKRRERQKEREALAAKQAAADRELLKQLLVPTGGNFRMGPDLEDLRVVKAVLKTGMPLDRVIGVIRRNVDPRCYPANPPLTSWENLLKPIAEDFCKALMVPALVKEWSNARAVKPADAQGAPPDAPGATPETMRPPQEAAGASEASEPSPAHSTAQSDAIRSMTAAELIKLFSPDPVDKPIEADQPKDEPTVAQPPRVEAPKGEATRESIIAAFKRPQQPKALAPKPPSQIEGDEDEISETMWEEFVSGYWAGNVPWMKRLGPAPGRQGCRAPISILQKYGMA
jgi:hypothetical protein